uniref:Uncharacterized protein n=1 Tax=Ditylenchus dipsaci TaxID=166011 RepID=A0A915EGV3_9BILA
MSLFCTKLNNRVKLAKSASLLDAHESLVSLYRSLLKNYDKDLRPSLRHDLPVDVSFTFSLTHIIDVDERNQILTTNAWIHQTWRDYNLIWDPRLFDGITTVHIPFELLWRPDVILYNNAASEYTKSVMSTDIIVSYDGNVSWTMAGIFKSSCGLDVRYYPFDFQNCVLKFASWAYDGTKLILDCHPILGISPTTWKVRNGICTSSSEIFAKIMCFIVFLRFRAQRDSVIYSCCPEPYPFIDVQITIQRRPMFFVFNLILPCVMISGIALLGFYMPSDSGEKVTLGITALLSTTVFLMLVAEGMPPTSEALPLIGIYYGVTIFIVSLTTGMTVFTLNVHHHGQHGKPVPELVQRLAFDYAARLMFIKIEQYHSINDHVEYFYSHSSTNVSRSMSAATVTGHFTELFGGTGDLMATNQLRVCTPTRRGVSSDIPYRSYNNNALLSKTTSSGRPISGSQKSPSDYRGSNKNFKKAPPSLSSMSFKSKRVSFSDDSLSSSSLPPNGIPTVSAAPVTLQALRYRATSKKFHYRPTTTVNPRTKPGEEDKKAPICGGESESESASNEQLACGKAAVATKKPAVFLTTSSPLTPYSSPAKTVNVVAGDGEPSCSADIRVVGSGQQQQRCASLSPAYRPMDNVSPIDVFESEFLRVLAKVHATIERNEMRLAEKDRRNAMKLEWQQVALVLDRFFFYLFVTITVVSSLSIIYQRQI